MIDAAELTLCAALILLRILFIPIRVKGRSMLDTLSDGDLLLVKRTRAFRRRDVVICHYPNRFRGKHRLLRQSFVKRVIGLPGETVEVRSGVVYITGSPLRERYLAPAHTRRDYSMPPRKLGPDEYFVMGDNRDASNDSRRIGPIRADAMVGRVLWAFTLPDHWRRL